MFTPIGTAKASETNDLRGSWKQILGCSLLAMWKNADKTDSSFPAISTSAATGPTEDSRDQGNFEAVPLLGARGS